MVLYRGQMERRIKENWVWAGEDLALEVKVQFDVTATGSIQNVRVVGSSGNRSYDASAERAVRAASPLAPPPEKYRDLFVHGVEITFRAQDLQS
jgi:colicin import membrane protein